MSKDLIDNFKAIHALVGGAITQKAGGEIIYHDGQTPPNEEEIKTKLKELLEEYDSKLYARSRESEYPNLQECIHALLDGGDTLTELQTKRSKIKQKYPKET